MLIGERIAAALPELRAHAESRMTTPCEARPVVGVSSNGSGDDVIEYGPAVYVGLCRLRNRGAIGQTGQSADSTRSVDRLEWHIPFNSPECLPGTVVLVDGVARYRVVSPADDDDVTARRYPVERVL